MITPAMLAAAVGTVKAVVVLNDLTLSDTGTPSTTVGIRLNADGTVDKRVHLTYTPIQTGTDWIRPVVLAGVRFSARYTNLVGDALTTAPAAENTWITLNGNREFSLGSPAIPGADLCTFTIEIRDNATGTTLDTAAMDFTAVEGS